MFFQGLEHTAIATPNSKRLAEWYVEHLGFVINHTYDDNYFVKAPNGAMLEIVPSEDDPVATKTKTPGLRHLAVWADDFDGACAELRRQGVAFLSEPLEVKGNRLVFFTDCDGNLLHLIHRPRPLP